MLVDPNLTTLDLDSSVLVEFASALREYKLGQIKDPFDIVNNFRSVAGLKALENAGTSGGDERNSEYQDWELEAKLWHLTQLLMDYRSSDDLPELTTYPFNSNIVYLENIYRSNPKLREIWLIQLWVQENLPIPERPSEHLSTSKWLNTQLSNSLESLDSDAPLRLHKSINPKDQEQDNIFFKYVYELILAGRFDEASQECDHTNNWTLKMILSGMNEYCDPTIDKQMGSIDDSTTGNKHKSLWRRTVYLLSKKEELPEYERLIYSYLVGDLTPLEKCQDWDTELLIYVNHILLNELEAKLIELNRVDKSEILINFPIVNITVQQVLNTIAESRKEESKHPLRVLTASIITNNIGPIVHSSLSFVGSIMLGNEESNELLNESYALRVITHLAIFVSLIDPKAIEVEDSSKLITTYILLLRLYGQYELIPLYISFLPEIEARDAYSLFLIDLFDSSERSKQLELSRSYKLPLENILKRTVEKVFSITEDHYQIKSGIVTAVQEVDEVDNKLIRGVEWFIEANMYSDAIHAAISLFRRFLLTGRTKAVEMFASRNNIQQLLKKGDVEKYGRLVEEEVSELEREELLQYDSLISGLTDVEKWNTRSKIASNNMTLIDLVNSITKNLNEIINTLFVNLVSRNYEAEIIQDLRSLYIPYFIIQLHNIYVDARYLSTSYLTKALELTNLVAEESDKFYLLFQNCGRLKEYLGMVANCAALDIGEGF